MDHGELDHQFKPIDKESGKCVARSRWKLLAKVLRDSNSTGSLDDDLPRSLLDSTTSRELYGLFKWSAHESQQFWENDSVGQWLKCSCDSLFPQFSLNIRYLSKQFSVSELIGFNNTGNICIWPSEEVLAYYCLKHSDIFRHKSVIELGGGMTCLASLTIAQFSDASSVCCTDGNLVSVENINLILQNNKFDNCMVTSQVLDWKDKSSSVNMESKWDIILCADCLFFDDGREALVETMQRITTNNGLILIMAPRRGRTLDRFLELCHGKFLVYLQEEFDREVTLLHQEKLMNPNYNADHNYPILVQLRKC